MPHAHLLFPSCALVSTRLLLAVVCASQVSGAHLNPAVTLALVLHRNFAPMHALAYVGAQLAGAAAGAALNYAAFAHAIRIFESARGLVRGGGGTAALASAPGLLSSSSLVRGSVYAMALEAVQQAVLTFVVLSATDKRSAPPAAAVPPIVGLTVAALIATFGPLTSAGFNPARDLGPRLVAALAGWGGSAFSGWWVYTAGPLLGTLCGGALYKLLYGGASSD